MAAFRPLATLACILLALAPPAALAGHVGGDYDPCSTRTPGTIEVRLVGCPEWPEGDCYRDGQPIPPTCPDPRAPASCLAIGARVEHDLGLAAEWARSAARTPWGGRATADAEQQSAAAPGPVEEATLATSCVADLESSCESAAEAVAADVQLLNGLVVAKALEARAGITCYGGPSTQTRFTQLVIAGNDLGPVVHPGTRIVVPGVAVVHVGEESVAWTPYGLVATATALRVELLDANGQTQGEVRVSHASALLNVW